jgi:hypothetical protein
MSAIPSTLHSVGTSFPVAGAEKCIPVFLNRLGQIYKDYFNFNVDADTSEADRNYVQAAVGNAGDLVQYDHVTTQLTSLTLGLRLLHNCVSIYYL